MVDLSRDKAWKEKLADNCIRLLTTSLKQDICGVDAPGSLVANIERGQVEQYLSPEVQYVYVYWIQIDHTSILQ